MLRMPVGRFSLFPALGTLASLWEAFFCEFVMCRL